LQDLDYSTLSACACDGAFEEAYFFQGCNGIAASVGFERKDEDSITPAIRLASESQVWMSLDSFDDTAFTQEAIKLTDSNLTIVGRMRVGYDKFFDLSDTSIVNAVGLSITPLVGSELDWARFVVATDSVLMYSPAAGIGANRYVYQVNETEVRIAAQVPGVSPDRGNADATLTFENSVPTQRFSTALTGDRTVTLPTTGVVNGSSFRVIREATATGSAVLDVGGLVSLAQPGQWCDVEYDGSAWRLTATGTFSQLAGIGPDRGDNDVTLNGLASAPIQQFNTPLGADRAVTLPTTGVSNGRTFRIVRRTASTGAFNLNIGTGPLKALATGEWCDVAYDGSAWVLTAFGSL
jgi:hypothetical protein